MKLRQEQLVQNLKNKLAPIYLISGDEPLLIQESCRAISKCAKENGFVTRNKLFADKNFNWQNLLTTANNLSLFSEKALIDLNIQTGKPGDAGSKALQAYAKNPPADKILLITTSKLDTSTKKNKWLKAIENAGIFIQVWPIDRTKLPNWIASRMQQAGLQTNSDGLNLLADYVEGNLLAAAQEIEKLRLLYGSGMLNTEQITAAIADNAKFNIFDLTNAIRQRNSKKALRILHSFKNDKTEPILILWVLARELRTSKAALPTLQHCAKIDRIIKGVQKGNMWNELEKLCLKLSAS
jgi:DNA polymerase-3 subunit delta